MRATTFMSLTFAFIGAGDTTAIPFSPEARYKLSMNIMCDIPGYHDVENTDSGIAHLNSLSGNATLGHQEGGGWCYRYSCSYNAGIYGCNDNQYDVDVPWSRLAQAAQIIKRFCTREKEDGEHHWGVIQGQAFDPDGWNVIVGLKDGTTC